MIYTHINNRFNLTTLLIPNSFGVLYTYQLHNNNNHNILWEILAYVALLFFVASPVDLDSSSSSDAATNSYQIGGGAGNADGAERSLRSYSYRHHSRPKRVVPPATSIPRFRKYAVDDFNFLKVLGKGSFGKVRMSDVINH